MSSSRERAMAPNLQSLSVDQLKMVRDQADAEVSLLQDSLNNIRTASSRLESAAKALRDLSLQPPGKKMLIPLTASLYVPGALHNADNVLVDVGTGYFIEKTMAEGKDYCDRKINMLKVNYEELVEVTAKKRGVADEVGAVLQAKLKQAAASSS